MNATERLYRIDNLLRQRRCVPLKEFLADLGVSRATFKRDLDTMRDRMNAPIVWDRELGGYRFEEQPGAGPRYQLPGLWFSPREAEALLTMHQLLESLQPSLLGAHVKPLLARITALLATGDRSAREVRRRIR
ncbi:MAG TPA: transcriptional regulator, partial [Myxococcota bacterium]|nr:transcriptional regulator [Myxococcota bacterium]